MYIREFSQNMDSEGVRACIVDLQDFERNLDPRMPAGSEVVDALYAEMIDRCNRFDGRIYVAEGEGDVAGYVAILPRIWSEETEDGELEYGLVTDLMVKEKYRMHGLGRRLLGAAEQYALEKGAQYLRVEVLARNGAARGLYTSFGFSDHVVSLEKSLPRESGDPDERAP